MADRCKCCGACKECGARLAPTYPQVIYVYPQPATFYPSNPYRWGNASGNMQTTWSAA